MFFLERESARSWVDSSLESKYEVESNFENLSTFHLIDLV